MSVIKPTYKYVELTLRPWWKRFCLGIYIQGNWLSKRRNKRKAGPSCWLDGGRSECKLAVDCKKGAGFKQTKWLHQSREKFAVSPEDQVMTFWSLIQHSNVKRAKHVNCSITINCMLIVLMLSWERIFSACCTRMSIVDLKRKLTIGDEMYKNEFA